MISDGMISEYHDLLSPNRAGSWPMICGGNRQRQRTIILHNFVIEEYSLIIESWKFRNTSSLVWS